MSTEQDLTETYIAVAREELGKAAETIRHCLAQLNDDQVSWRAHPAMNSIGNLVLHLCGNVRQWIVSGVGGEPDCRDRPGEFAERGSFPRQRVLEQMADVLEQADRVIANASSATLLEPCRIQGFETNRMAAIFDSVAHFKGHAQEIVCLTRMQLGSDYRFEWIPTTPEEGAPC
jgi:hypothetical protein